MLRSRRMRMFRTFVFVYSQFPRERTRVIRAHDKASRATTLAEFRDLLAA